MSASIFDYLTKIQAGKTVNIDVLLTRLEQCGYSRYQLSRVFASVNLGKCSYQVTINDPAAFAALIERFRPSGMGDRVGAALDGDSHRVGVSGACLLLRSRPYPHPVVALYENGDWHCPRAAGSIGVIVENMENFLALEPTLALVSGLLLRAPQDVELIYGAGNQVTKRLNSDFLATFDELHCLFDVDPGGLRMYAALRKLLPASIVRFLAPDDIEERLRCSRYDLTEKSSQDIWRHKGLSPETDRLIWQMRLQGKMLEQETYLHQPPGKGPLA